MHLPDVRTLRPLFVYATYQLRSSELRSKN